MHAILQLAGRLLQLDRARFIYLDEIFYVVYCHSLIYYNRWHLHHRNSR